jgi:hypothetical protein
MSDIVYRITNLDDGKAYVGSTCRKVTTRIQEHSSRSKKGTNRCECRYFNWDNIHVEEVEIPDIVIDNIRIREAYVIKNTKNCINKTLPFITEEERKERGKQYREINKERIRETKKRYIELNKERIREKNRERITCECGSHINRNEFSRHKKTKKHKNF